MRSLVFPSWGDFVLKHTLLACLELLGYVLAWIVMLGLLLERWSDPAADPTEQIVLPVVLLGFIAFTHISDAILTWFVAGKGLHPKGRPPALRGQGGRNQQLVLAAAEWLWADGATNLALLSGGTDGEDGPTNAAGAVLDEAFLTAARAAHRHPADWLARNDAWNYFQPLGGLIQTGPTHTNVCDVRVVLVDRGSS